MWIFKSVPPLRLEFSTFVSFIKDECEVKFKFVDFWGIHGARFPILLRIVASLLSISVCSTEVESLFYISGNSCSIERNSMSGQSIDTLLTLHYWLKEEYEYSSRKDRRRIAKDKRFTSLQFDLQIINGELQANNEDISDDEY